METGTLHQIQMKKKKMKHDLCYVGLVVLIIFLLIPPALRLFIKDKSETEEKKTIYISLNCQKVDESINATFKDGVPQNVMYSVKGNINENVVSNPDEVDNTTTTSVATEENNSSVDQGNNVDTTNQETVDTNSQTTSNLPFKDSDTIYKILSRFGEFTYDSSIGASVLRVPYSSLSAYSGYDEVFGTIENQENLYTSRGFSCAQVSF